MKKTLLILTIVATILPLEQAEPNQPQAKPNASSANPRLPWWFSNPPATSQSAPNMSNRDLEARLTILQKDLQAAFPLVASFNANLPSAERPRSEPAEEPSNIPAPVRPVPTGENYSSNYGQNLSSRIDANASQNLSVPVGYTPPSPASASGFWAVVPPTTPPTVDPLNPPLPSPTPDQNEAPPVDPTSEALRQLLTLQDEIQQMLPVIDSLNAGGLNLARASMPINFGAGGERFYAAPAGTRPPLTPTGR
jgi:hypothetical protein